MAYVHQAHVLPCSNPELVQYLPRNGIATPAQIIEAAGEGM